MPIGFFSRAQTGALVTRLNSDVQGAQQAFTSTLSNVVGNVVAVVATLAAMFVLSWQITLLALALLPLFVLPARWVGRRLADITRERYRLNGEMGQMMTERFNVSGALARQAVRPPGVGVRARSSRRAGRVRDIGVTSAMYSRVVMTSLGLLASLATALVYGLGGVMAIAGSLGIGTLVALTAYLGRLYGPLTALSNVQVDVMTTLVSFERVLEVLDLEPTIVDAADPIALPSGPVAVELDDVRFRYPTAAEVSLASLEGVARLDDNGAGRGAARHLAARRAGPHAGPRRPVGRRQDDASPGWCRGSTTRPPAPCASAASTCATPPWPTSATPSASSPRTSTCSTTRSPPTCATPSPTATDDELEAALRAAQVWDVVAAMPDGLDTVVGDRGHRLSGGEKQRIAIARLLLKDPGVVVLDEATAHLDAGSEAAVQAALATALAGRTSIVIAHRLATVRAADEIAVVDGGRVVERGTHDELVAAGGLYAA